MRTPGNRQGMAEKKTSNSTQKQQAQSAHREEMSMSLFRYKGSKVWTMDFMFHGQRIRERTGTRSQTLAQKIESKRRQKLEEGAGGIRRRERSGLCSVAADDWLENKKGRLAPKTVLIEKTNLAHLKPELGRKLVCDIDALDISRYQQKRLGDG